MFPEAREREREREKLAIYWWRSREQKVRVRSSEFVARIRISEKVIVSFEREFEGMFQRTEWKIIIEYSHQRFTRDSVKPSFRLKLDIYINPYCARLCYQLSAIRNISRISPTKGNDVDVSIFAGRKRKREKRVKMIENLPTSCERSVLLRPRRKMESICERMERRSVKHRGEDIKKTLRRTSNLEGWRGTKRPSWLFDEQPRDSARAVFHVREICAYLLLGKQGQGRTEEKKKD